MVQWAAAENWGRKHCSIDHTAPSAIKYSDYDIPPGYFQNSHLHMCLDTWCSLAQYWPWMRHQQNRWFILGDCLAGVSGNDFWGFGTGTGIENSIPKVREREGNWKSPFPKFANGKGMKKRHSRNLGTGREWKKHSQNSGTGIRGYYSWEWTGTGMEQQNHDV